MKRSGCDRIARSPSSPCTPIRPFSTPHRSISRSVTPTRSTPSPDSIVLSGESLNMYSAGNSKSSFDSLSFVCRVMKA